jgi:predicted Fe-Mo cluster-binding NifX family protein
MKMLIPLHEEEVAPRFDLATEVLIAELDDECNPVEVKNIVLPQASAEDLCQLILHEGISLVVCGGIEEEYYQYLTWKKIRVIDSIIGHHEQVVRCFKDGTLVEGAILMGTT